MPSVTCKIRSKRHPARWIEIDIGVDESGDNYWTLIAKSAVSFSQFNATSGRWDPVTFFVKNPSGGFTEMASIALISGVPDPYGGIVLFQPGPHFYRLGCGQHIVGQGAREDAADLTYRMDFPCV